MKSWKVWVPIAAVGGAVVIGAIVWLVLQGIGSFSAPIAAADRFLGMLGQGKVAEAYQAAAPALRERMTSAQFAEKVRQLGLNEFESSSFPSVSLKDGTATLDGSITRKGGGVVPIKLTLARSGSGENVVWRVSDLSGQVPEREAIVAMLRESLRAFNGAVQSGSFDAFHARLAKPFREQYSAERLKTVFAQFVDRQIDLSPALELKPVFEPEPTVGDRQVLQVSGHFPSRPSRLEFDLKYVPEDGSWKLIAISVHVKPQNRNQ